MQSTVSNISLNPNGTKAKHWTFTIINPNDAHIRKFEDIKEFTTYWIYGEEIAPTTGVPHLQCYLVGKKQITKPTMRKWFGDNGNTYAVSLGSPEQNKIYCSKDGKFTEYGVLPEPKHHAGGEATKKKWQDIANLAMKQEHIKILEEHPKEFVAHYRNLKQIGFDFQTAVKDLDAPCGEWIYGSTGVGKSTTARRENPGAFVKPMNKWWDGYKGQDVVIIEDMSPSFGPSMEYFMKIWPDSFAFPAEIKNHTVQLRPKKIVVTSQYHPSQIWFKEALDAITRRFKIRQILEVQKKDVFKFTKKSKQIKKVKSHDKPYMKAKAPKKFKDGKMLPNKDTQPKLDYLSDPKDVIKFNEVKANNPFVLTLDEAKNILGPVPIDWNKVHTDSPDAQDINALIDCAEIEDIQPTQNEDYDISSCSYSDESDSSDDSSSDSSEY